MRRLTLAQEVVLAWAYAKLREPVTEPDDDPFAGPEPQVAAPAALPEEEDER